MSSINTKLFTYSLCDIFIYPIPTIYPSSYSLWIFYYWST